MTNFLKNKRVWAVVLIVISALFGVGATRMFSPLDDINKNHECNVRQEEHIKT